MSEEFKISKKDIRVVDASESLGTPSPTPEPTIAPELEPVPTDTAREEPTPEPTDSPAPSVGEGDSEDGLDCINKCKEILKKCKDTIAPRHRALLEDVIKSNPNSVTRKSRVHVDSLYRRLNK